MYVIKVTLGSHTAYLTKKISGPKERAFSDDPSDVNVEKFKIKQSANAEARWFSLFHVWTDGKPIETSIEKYPTHCVDRGCTGRGHCKECRKIT